MILLNMPVQVGEVSEIGLQLFTIRIVARPLRFALHSEFDLHLGGKVTRFDPVRRTGPIEELRKLVQRTPTAAADEGTRFSLSFDDGSEILLPYLSGLTHVEIFGPAEDMWTPLPG